MLNTNVNAINHESVCFLCEKKFPWEGYLKQEEIFYSGKAKASVYITNIFWGGENGTNVLFTLEVTVKCPHCNAKNKYVYNFDSVTKTFYRKKYDQSNATYDRLIK